MTLASDRPNALACVRLCEVFPDGTSALVTRALGWTALGDAARSPFVQTTTGHAFEIRLDRKVPYELDGGERKATRHLTAVVEPGTIDVCVPEGDGR